MAFQYYEGTADYIAATPALIVTFRTSGSVAAGNFVAFDAGNTGDVYQPAVASGSVAPAGLALQTRATGQDIAILVHGYAKNIPYLGATCYAGNNLFISGSSATTSAGAGIYTIGRVVTGSATGGTVVAFIDCLKVTKS